MADDVRWDDFTPVDEAVDWSQFEPVDSSRDTAEAKRLATQSEQRKEQAEIDAASKPAVRYPSMGRRSAEVRQEKPADAGVMWELRETPQQRMAKPGGQKQAGALGEGEGAPGYVGPAGFAGASKRKREAEEEEVVFPGGWKESETQRSFKDIVNDVGVTALKSAIGLPQSVVGIADIPTLGYAGKAAEAAGIRFEEAQQILDSAYSDAQKKANAAVRSADGFFETLGAIKENPSTVAVTVGESASQMLGGAGIARGFMKLAPKLAPWLAGALGEGAIGGGSAAEQIRGESGDGLLTPKQAFAAAASGVGTAAFGAAGGKLAQRLGFADVDTMLAAGRMVRLSNPQFARALVMSGVNEGAFEELPQSVQEQMWQNFATGKPITEGAGSAGATGMVAGFAMGAAGGGFNAAANAMAPQPPPPLTPEQKIDQVFRASAPDIAGKSAVEQQLRQAENAAIMGAQTADEAIAAAAEAVSRPSVVAPEIDKVVVPPRPAAPVVPPVDESVFATGVPDAAQGQGLSQEVPAAVPASQPEAAGQAAPVQQAAEPATQPQAEQAAAEPETPRNWRWVRIADRTDAELAQGLQEARTENSRRGIQAEIDRRAVGFGERREGLVQPSPQPVVQEVQTFTEQEQVAPAEQFATTEARQKIAAAPTETIAKPVAPQQRQTKTQAELAETLAQRLERRAAIAKENDEFDRAAELLAEAESVRFRARPGMRRAARADDFTGADEEVAKDLSLPKEQFVIARDNELDSDTLSWSKKYGVEAYYDENTDKFVVFTGNIYPTAYEDRNGKKRQVLSKRDRLKWVMVHEAYHRGFRVYEEGKYKGPISKLRDARGFTETLAKVASNKNVSTIAQRLVEERGKRGNVLQKGMSIEEAMVEIGTAVTSGRWDELKGRYGVDISPPSQYGMKKAWNAFVDFWRKVLRKVTNKDVPFSDSEVLAVLKQVKKAAGKPIPYPGGKADTGSRAQSTRQDRLDRDRLTAELDDMRREADRLQYLVDYAFANEVPINRQVWRSEWVEDLADWSNYKDAKEQIKDLRMMADVRESVSNMQVDEVDYTEAPKPQVQDLMEAAARGEFSDPEYDETLPPNIPEVAYTDRVTQAEREKAPPARSAEDYNVGDDRAEAIHAKEMNESLARAANARVSVPSGWSGADAGQVVQGAMRRQQEREATTPREKRRQTPKNFRDTVFNDHTGDLFTALPKAARERLMKAWKEMVGKPGFFELEQNPWTRTQAASIDDALSVGVVREAISVLGLDKKYDIEVTTERSTNTYGMAGRINFFFYAKRGGERGARLGQASMTYHNPDGYRYYTGPAGYPNRNAWFYVLHTTGFNNDGVGKKFYMLANQVAAMNGILISPDSILTKVNTYRRTENMIAAALRLGDKMTIIPHEHQKIYGWNHRPATAEQYDRNLVRMVVASARNVQRIATQNQQDELLQRIDDLRYDPNEDRFFMKDGSDGEALASHIWEKSATNQWTTEERYKERWAGRTTVARMAMTQAILAKEAPQKKVVSVKKPLVQSTSPQPLAKTPPNITHSKDQESFDRAVANELLMAARDENYRPQQYYTAGLVPNVLQKIGVEPKSLVVQAPILHKMHFDHGLTPSKVKSLPSLISDPVMVFESATVEGSYYILTDAGTAGKPMYIAVNPKGEVGRIELPDVRTASPIGVRPNFVQWIKDGKLLYANKAKARQFSTTNGVQFPGVVQRAVGFQVKKYLTELDVKSRTPIWTEQVMLSTAPVNTPEFSEWFGDSKVVDEGGNPMLVYHSTNAGHKEWGGIPTEAYDFQSFDTTRSEMGSHFGTREQSNDFGAGHLRRVIPAYLSIKNPLRMKDYGGFSPGEVAGQLVSLGIITNEEADRIIDDSGFQYLNDQKFLQDKIKEAGYDGIVYLNRREGYGSSATAWGDAVMNNDELSDEDWKKLYTSASDSWIAFDRGQIKSPFNVGTFDPANDDFMKSTAPGNPLNSWDIPDETKWQTVRRYAQDYMLRVKVLQDALKEQGGTVDESRDVAAAAERMHGRIQVASERLKEQFMKPLMKKLADNELTPDDLAIYSYAKHAPERNEHIARIRPSMNDGGSGMTNDDAQAIIDTADQAGLKAPLESAHKDLMALGAATRRILLEEGLISQQTYDNWESLYENYIPLRGFEHVDEEGSVIRTGRGVDVRGKESIRALGRRSRAANLIENMILDYERAIVRAEKNLVGRTFFSLVQANPDPTLWEIDPNRVSTTFDKQRDLVIQRRVPDKGEDTIAYKEGGDIVYIKVKDPLLLRAMKRTYMDESGEFQHILSENIGWYNTWLRNTLTAYNPAFLVVNGIRDSQTGAFSALDKLGPQAIPKYTRHYFGAMKAAWNMATLKNQNTDWGPWVSEFENAGAITGGFYMRDAKRVSEELKGMLVDAGGTLEESKPGIRGAVENAYLKARGSLAGKMAAKTVQLVEHMGQASENMSRLSLYRTARELGKTPAEAASIAKNGTVNFNTKGELGTGINALYLFYNASVQGAARTLEAMKSPYVQTALAGQTAIAAALAALAPMIGGDDDDEVSFWDKIPDYEKERNLIIMLPPKDGRANYIKVPAPYGFSVFNVLGYAMSDTARWMQDPRRGKSPMKGAINMASAILGSYNPFGGNLDPTDAKSLLLLASPTITDLPIMFGAEINSFGDRTAPPPGEFYPRPDSERFFLSDSGTVQQRLSRWLNKATGGNQAQSGMIDVAPATFETAVRAATGGSGMFVMDVVNTLSQMIDPAEDVQAKNIPWFKSVYGKSDERTTARQFYENRDEIEKDYKQLLAAQKIGVKVEMDEQNKALVRIGKHMQMVNEYMSKLRKAEVAIIENERLTDTEKKAKRKELTAQREKLMKGFNKAFKEVWAPVR